MGSGLIMLEPFERGVGDGCLPGSTLGDGSVGCGSGFEIVSALRTGGVGVGSVVIAGVGNCGSVELEEALVGGGGGDAVGGCFLRSVEVAASTDSSGGGGGGGSG